MPVPRGTCKLGIVVVREGGLIPVILASVNILGANVLMFKLLMGRDDDVH
jgi:hypothetical protein